MLSALVKVVLVGVILVAGAFFLFGYWTGGSLTNSSASTVDLPSPSMDTATARERGAELGEQAAKVVATAGAALDEGTLTAKIKAKMVLDDLVKARAIDVTTERIRRDIDRKRQFARGTRARDIPRQRNRRGDASDRSIRSSDSRNG